MDLHFQNLSSDQEKAEFEELVNNSENEAELLRLLEEKWTSNDFSLQQVSEARANEIFQKIIQPAEIESGAPEKIIRLVPWWRISVAIILILLCVTGAYLYFSPLKKATGDAIAKNQTIPGDVLPGTHSATLELSDGKIVLIDSMTQGQLADEGVVALKIGGKRLKYSFSKDSVRSADDRGRYNTLKTGNGQEYEVTFVDGTQIWLNPGSSIRYPVPFNGNLRSVAITGEVEFEVTRNPKAPFSVSVAGAKNHKGLTVNVLGTHFKINAYPEESKVKTTLIEGSVELVSGDNKLTMKPGQQGSLDSAGELHVVNIPSAGKIVDLKSGLFFFDNDDIKSVLREIARWYDVELIYEGEINENKFSGEIQKSLTLKSVMKKLDKRVQFKLEDKKLIISQ